MSDDDAGAEAMAALDRVGSLGRQLAMATLAFCFMFTLCAVGARTYFAWRDNVAAMTAELALIDQVYERPLSKAMWDLDSEELQRHMATLSSIPALGRVELRILRAGRAPELLTNSKPGLPSGNSGPALHRSLTFAAYPGDAKSVGELTLQGDERVLWAQLRDELAGIALTQVIQCVLLAGLIMWLFNQSVTVHVRKIARHLGDITPSNLGVALHLDRKSLRRDELSLLVAGVNQLQIGMGNYLNGQRAAERDLAAHRDRLADLVDEQTADLRAANAKLEALSRSDALTGLANRRHYEEVREAEYRRAARSNQPLSLLVCDIDYFKRYNDTYGHAMGDQCLKSVAQTIKETFGRAGEFAARIGGEEFAVLLPSVDITHARLAADKLRDAVNRRAIAHSGSEVASHVTLSVGIAQLDMATMDSFDEVFIQADQALYRAKNSGRNRVAA